MFETLNFTFNWIGILLQIIGVAIGAYVLTHLKYREGSFDSESFDSRFFDTGDDMSNLPKHPQTKEPVFPLVYNRKTASISIGCLIVGLTLQIIALHFSS
ncbi:MAG: hypothetical protein WD717_02845 [Nitrosarchaeum sp.]